jgi:hypothetical protein
MAREFSSLITPGTIVIADLNRGYEGGKYLYLMLDHLSNEANRPNVFTIPTNPMMSKLIDEPLQAPSYAPETLAYIWSKLRDQKDEVVSNKDWKRIVFVIQLEGSATVESSEWYARLMNRCEAPKTRFIKAGGAVANSLFFVECDTDQLKSISPMEAK